MSLADHTAQAVVADLGTRPVVVGELRSVRVATFEDATGAQVVELGNRRRASLVPKRRNPVETVVAVILSRGMP